MATEPNLWKHALEANFYQTGSDGELGANFRNLENVQGW